MVELDWLRMVDARLGKKIRKYEDRANQFLELCFVLVCLFASWSGVDVMGKEGLDAESTSLLMLEVAMPRLQRHVAPGNERCPQMCTLVAWQILL